jgi:hypothetical protein
MKTWTDQHLRWGLDNFKRELFQQADALWKLFSELNFGLDKDTSIENNFHIFRKLYYCDIFKCIQFHLAYNPFQAHIDLIWCTVLTLRVIEITARCIWVIGGGIHNITCWLPQGLCQSYVHPRRLTWPIFLVISIPSCCFLRLGLFQKISARRLKCVPKCLPGWFPVPH